MRRTVVALAGLAAVLSAIGGEDDANWSTRQGGGSFVVDGSRIEAHGAGDRSGGASGPVDVVEYSRAHLCAGAPDRMDLEPSCLTGPLEPPECLGGAPAQLPLWRREQLPDTTWTPWVAITTYTCPGDAPLIEAIEREWSELAPPPSGIQLQPSTTEVIGSMPTIAVAHDAPMTHRATLLGTAVQIRATPASYTWHWGDGNTTTTADPGAPYPNHTISHAYDISVDAATVWVATTWTGEWRIGNGAWVAFDDTIATTTPGIDLIVLHPRSTLVDCDLNENCVRTR